MTYRLTPCLKDCWCLQGYEPRTKDFWLAQRSALALPQVGFVTTTDIERNLHPPDKQDVAHRLVLEL